MFVKSGPVLFSLRTMVQTVESLVDKNVLI